MPQRFTNLLFANPVLSPGEQQRQADVQFATMFSGSALRFWRLGDGIGTGGLRLLVGVSTYSHNDLWLLDTLETRLKNGGDESEISIDVLNMVDITFIQLEDCFEEHPLMCTTPIVAVWTAGRKVEIAYGTNTLPLIYKFFPGPVG